MQTSAKAAGCYKCGKTGHWSRDCTVPQSEWIPRNSQPSLALANQTTSDNPDAKDSTGLTPPPPAPGKGKRQPKPKLTFDVLKRKEGLPEVFLTFADRFQKRFKGKGHEAGDLLRLLEMYERWQRKLFPSLQFDDFISTVEKIGRTSEVKVELRTLRQDAIKVMEPDPEQEADATADGSPRGIPSERAAAAADAWDDEELLDMQQQGYDGGVGAGIDEDEELLQMAEQPMPMQRRMSLDDANSHPADNAGGTGNNDDDDIDEEELLALARGSQPSLAATDAADDDFAVMIEVEDEILGWEEEPRQGSTARPAAATDAMQEPSAPSSAKVEEPHPHEEVAPPPAAATTAINDLEEASPANKGDAQGIPESAEGQMQEPVSGGQKQLSGLMT